MKIKQGYRERYRDYTTRALTAQEERYLIRWRLLLRELTVTTEHIHALKQLQREREDEYAEGGGDYK